MNNNFIEIAKKCNRDRFYAEKYKSFNKKVAEYYALFCVWCRAYHNAEFIEENFNKFIEKYPTNFMIIKEIFEKYYGYKYYYDYDDKKWVGTKII